MLDPEGKGRELRIKFTLNKNAQTSSNIDDIAVHPHANSDPIIKGCFIATAAMDSELHPYVESLRKFRDDILLQSKYKQTFERLLDSYYRFSPSIAVKMKRHKFIKVILRYILVYPIVFAIKILLPIFDLALGIRKSAKQKWNCNNSC